jgi:hypothetical protein
MTAGQLGRKGERKFTEQMEARTYMVQNVSKDPTYYDKDIDFIVTSPFTGAVKSFEVKYDTRINYTNNLYLEMININSKQWNGEGWWKHCEADFLAYGDAATEQFYIIPVIDLKERVKELPERVGNCGYESAGLLVSLDDIQDIIKVL